jgi:hypothetical protein
MKSYAVCAIAAAVSARRAGSARPDFLSDKADQADCSGDHRRPSDLVARILSDKLATTLASR